MGEPTFEYKPVVVGNSGLTAEIEHNLQLSTIYGVNVHTDSAEMHRCIQLSGASVNGARPQDSNTNFYYLTQNPLPFVNANGQPLQQIQVEYPGDIYMSPDMKNFYFWGIDKLGTLVSMIYGIRAIKGIEENKVGLHSALILDQEKQTVHLIIGKNRIGKSSIGQAIEDSDQRFVMLSDDWNEVNFETGTVEPMSIIFSPKTPSEQYEQAFQSFGKPFFWKHGIRPYPELHLSSIIELYGNEQEIHDEMFLKRSMAHIPLLAQPISMGMFDTSTGYCDADLQRFADFQQRYSDAYAILTATYPTVKMINSKGNNTLEDVVQKILVKLR